MSLLNTSNRRFLWHTAILLNSGIISGVLYMLVHPILGRGMGDVEYAMFFSLLGLLNVLALPAPTIQVVMARYVAEYEGTDAASLWVTVLKRAFRRITLLGLVGLLLWSALAQTLQSALNVSTTWGIVFLGVVALVRLYAPIIQGWLQGSKHFAWYSASQIG